MNNRMKKIRLFSIFKDYYIFSLRHEWACHPKIFKYDFIGKLFLLLNKIDYKEWDNKGKIEINIKLVEVK